jgi:hypothetical protein
MILIINRVKVNFKVRVRVGWGAIRQYFPTLEISVCTQMVWVFLVFLIYSLESILLYVYLMFNHTLINIY